MAILLPTKTKGDIVVYSKWCVQCEQPDDLLQINLWALHNNLEVQVIRTAYRPADHKKAAELWGHQHGVEDTTNYPTFVYYKDDVYKMKDFAKMINDTENKLVKGGKTKDDVQRLPKTKRTARKSGVASKARKAKATAKEGSE